MSEFEVQLSGGRKVRVVRDMTGDVSRLPTNAMLSSAIKQMEDRKFEHLRATVQSWDRVISVEIV